MTKAKIDKDSNDYLSPDAQPASERETAYKNQSEIEGDSVVADRNGNGDDVFKGPGKILQAKRKADQVTTGASGSMDESKQIINNIITKFDKGNLSEVSKGLLVKYVDKATSTFSPTSIANKAHAAGYKMGTNLYQDDADLGSNENKKALKRSTSVAKAAAKISGIAGLARVSATESAGASGSDGVATAPATSDSPSMGMYSVNQTDFSRPDIDTKNMLEAIALQAAETFELIQENSKLPDVLTNELQNCADVLAKIYEFASQALTGNANEPQSGNLPAEQPQAPPMKEAVSTDIVSALTETFISKYKVSK